MLSTARIVMAVAAYHGVPLHHADVPQAFLQGEVNRAIYVDLPGGITVKSHILKALHEAYPNKDPRQKYCYRLIKSLYGLASSPHLFSKLISEFLVGLGLQRSRTDCTLFTRQDPTTGKWTIVTAFVDDLLITGTDKTFQDALRTALMTRFGKDLTWTDKIESFLGLHCHQSMDNRRITVQAKFKIDEMFKKLQFTEQGVQMNGAPAPWSTEFAKSLDSPTTSLTPRQTIIKQKFKFITGVLIYLSITCRPDISTILNRCCQGAADPQRVHVLMLEKLLMYLYNHRSVGLVFDGRTSTIKTQVVDQLATRYAELQELPKTPYICFSDANFADLSDPKLRSTSGHCLYVLGSLISWSSKRQSITAKSTLEAELIAGCSAADDAVWFHQFVVSNPFLFDFSSEDSIPPVPLLIDNQPALSTANHPRVTGQTKHIALRHFRIRDYAGDGGNVPRIRCYWVPTKLNPADFFSKLLAVADFRRLARWLVDLPYDEREDAKYANAGEYYFANLSDLDEFNTHPQQLFLTHAGSVSGLIMNDKFFDLLTPNSFYNDNSDSSSPAD